MCSISPAGTARWSWIPPMSRRLPRVIAFAILPATGILIRLHPARARTFSAQALKKRADLVAGLFAPHHALIRHPVELNDAARSFEGMKAMPGIRFVLEDQQSA